jgi:hypothetical protein
MLPVWPKLRLVVLTLGFALILWLAHQGGSWALSMPLPSSPTGVAVAGTIPGCLVGHVQVGAVINGGTIPALCQPYWVYVEFCGATIPTCGSRPSTIPVVADATGQFTICNIPPGTYAVLARGFNTLANLRTGVVVPEGGSVTVDFGTLTPGDADGNNKVDIFDFKLLYDAYGATSGGPGWDPRVDFNCDGAIQILDFSILSTYYGQEGERCPCCISGCS